MEDCSASLGDAFRHYQYAREISAKYQLSEAVARADNNLISLALLILASLIEPDTSSCPIEIAKLPSDLRAMFANMRGTADYAGELERLRRKIVATLGVRQQPQTLITKAQIDALLARAHHQINGTDKERVAGLLDESLSALRVAFLTFDELVVLEKPRVFHLGALLDLDERIKAAFESLSTTILTRK